MIYKPENSLNIGTEEYGILCSQEYLAGMLARHLEKMIQDSGWARPISEHPMWLYIAKVHENSDHLRYYRRSEAKKIRQHMTSI